MFTLERINTGYKLGTFVTMPRKYRKDYISRNGNNYYLQFHVADWMRQLPAFRQWPTNKKNFKRTLRTADPHEAAIKAEAMLLELQIKQRPQKPPVATGVEAYMQTLQQVETVPTDTLEELYEQTWEVFHANIEQEGEFGQKAVILDDAVYSNTKEGIAAIEREMRRRKAGKFFDEPMPHKITLKYAAEKYMEEMASEGRPKKTQSKVKNAAKRFLEFRELPDMELERISPKLLKQYINQARIENRAESTFKNDIHYLGSVFNWAKQDGWLENLPNPFRDLRITGLKSKTERWPFSHEMLVRMKEMPEVKQDHDIRQLFWISYFTGMRISEVFSARYKIVDGVLCFDVASGGGKTASARRIIPLHSSLHDFLGEPTDGDPVQFQATSATNLGKRFGRFKDRLLENMGQGGDKRHYGHHSFRHGFITALLAAGYNEVEIADLTGHKKSNIGRTEAGKTYYHRQNIKKLKVLIESVPSFLEVPFTYRGDIP